MTPHDWDAATYDRVATGVKALGHEVLERVELGGDEAVLDAGCGPGEVTEALVARLPAGRVVAVDASPQMVAAARERLGDRADVRCADLTELELEEPVDVVLSTATRARCWLTERPIVPDDPPAYARTVMLGAHLERLPQALHEAFVDAVIARLAAPLRIDYVRLNIDAVA